MATGGHRPMKQGRPGPRHCPANRERSVSSDRSQPRRCPINQERSISSDHEDSHNPNTPPDDICFNNWSRDSKCYKKSKGNPEREREQSLLVESPSREKKHHTPSSYPRTKITRNTPTSERVALESLKQRMTFSDVEDEHGHTGNKQNNERQFSHVSHNLPSSSFNKTCSEDAAEGARERHTNRNNNMNYSSKGHGREESTRHATSMVEESPYVYMLPQDLMEILREKQQQLQDLKSYQEKLSTKHKETTQKLVQTKARDKKAMTTLAGVNARMKLIESRLPTLQTLETAMRGFAREVSQDEGGLVLDRQLASNILGSAGSDDENNFKKQGRESPPRTEGSSNDGRRPGLNQTPSAAVVTFSSSDELYGQIRRQLILHEELQSQKRELKDVVRKARNKRQYSHKQVIHSDTASLSTDGGRFPTSAEVTMTTWGGSSMDNLQGVKCDEGGQKRCDSVSTEEGSQEDHDMKKPSRKESCINYRRNSPHQQELVSWLEDSWRSLEQQQQQENKHLQDPFNQWIHVIEGRMTSLTNAVNTVLNKSVTDEKKTLSVGGGLSHPKSEQLLQLQNHSMTLICHQLVQTLALQQGDIQHLERQIQHLQQQKQHLQQQKHLQLQTNPNNVDLNGLFKYTSTNIPGCQNSVNRDHLVTSDHNFPWDSGRGPADGATGCLEANPFDSSGSLPQQCIPTTGCASHLRNKSTLDQHRGFSNNSSVLVMTQDFGDHADILQPTFPPFGIPGGSRDQPSSDARISRSIDQPSSDARISRSIDQPSSDARISRSRDQPSSDARISRSIDQPSSDARISRSIDQPSSDARISRSRDQPSSDARISRSIDQPSLDARISRYRMSKEDQDHTYAAGDRSSSLVSSRDKRRSTCSVADSDKPINELNEDVYAEVASLISQNESRPFFLLELFRDIRQINSDRMWQQTLSFIHTLLLSCSKLNVPTKPKQGVARADTGGLQVEAGGGESHQKTDLTHSPSSLFTRTCHKDADEGEQEGNMIDEHQQTVIQVFLLDSSGLSHPEVAPTAFPESEETLEDEESEKEVLETVPSHRQGRREEADVTSEKEVLETVPSHRQVMRSRREGTDVTSEKEVLETVPSHRQGRREEADVTSEKEVLETVPSHRQVMRSRREGTDVTSEKEVLETVPSHRQGRRSRREGTDVISEKEVLETVPSHRQGRRSRREGTDVTSEKEVLEIVPSHRQGRREEASVTSESIPLMAADILQLHEALNGENEDNILEELIFYGETERLPEPPASLDSTVDGDTLDLRCKYKEEQLALNGLDAILASLGGMEELAGDEASVLDPDLFMF